MSIFAYVALLEAQSQPPPTVKARCARRRSCHASNHLDAISYWKLFSAFSYIDGRAVDIGGFAKRSEGVRRELVDAVEVVVARR